MKGLISIIALLLVSPTLSCGESAQQTTSISEAPSLSEASTPVTPSAGDDVDVSPDSDSRLGAYDAKSFVKLVDVYAQELASNPFEIWEDGVDCPWTIDLDRVRGSLAQPSLQRHSLSAAGQEPLYAIDCSFVPRDDERSMILYLEMAYRSDIDSKKASAALAIYEQFSHAGKQFFYAESTDHVSKQVIIYSANYRLFAKVRLDVYAQALKVEIDRQMAADFLLEMISGRHRLS